MTRVDRFLRGFEVFTNAIASLFITIGVVGGYSYFIKDFSAGRVGVSDWLTVIVWWLVISGRLSRNNELRR